MLRSVDKLSGFTIMATDGKIGNVDEFYFDDERWIIRYLVVNTGPWLLGRKVLISPLAVGNISWVTQTLSVHLTTAQVENSPDIDTDKPVSRQHEINLFGHYGWTPYWTPIPGPHGMAVPAPSQESAPQTPLEREKEAIREQEQDPHLRSTNEVIGYHIQASDGEIGHVEDFMVDEVSWVIQYMIVATSNWLPGKKVLISPKRIEWITWAENSVQVDLAQEAIKNRPEYDPIPVRADETKFHHYFN